ncbi:hypothetical protein QCA50_020684 [Cerrena zonata]|uniref:Uncharacterized protein n=1 Tax=Cerrena zonata TaxID=2478898 RepID=A0AAW0F7R9_9APHY
MDIDIPRDLSSNHSNALIGSPYSVGLNKNRPLGELYPLALHRAPREVFEGKASTREHLQIPPARESRLFRQGFGNNDINTDLLRW